MKKETLILDCDSTLIDSEKAFIECYNEIYKNAEGFVKCEKTHTEKWNFEDTCPLCKDVEVIFNHPMFFEKVQLFENAYRVLEMLQIKYNIYICTIGRFKNIKQKIDFIENKMPKGIDIVPIAVSDFSEMKMSKKIINMDTTNATFVDDHVANLISSNAIRKILYKNKGVDKNWNENWTGEVAHSMVELLHLLM